MTMNTRAALAAVNNVFGCELASDDSGPADCTAGSGGAGGGSGGAGVASRGAARGRRSMGPGMFDPTVTMSTRAALAAVNSMFGADLTGAVVPSPVVARGRPSTRFAGDVGGGGGVIGGASEPTMTLNTREAMRLVAGMFADGRPGGGDATQVGDRGARRFGRTRVACAACRTAGRAPCHVHGARV